MAVNVGQAASANTVAGGPSSTIRPAAIATTRSNVSATNRMSWLMATTVRPRDARSAMTAWIRATPRASWPVVGSSSTITGVSIASTDASVSSLRRE